MPIPETLLMITFMLPKEKTGNSHPRAVTITYRAGNWLHGVRHLLKVC
jgi:hypothetical protein